MQVNVQSSIPDTTRAIIGILENLKGGEGHCHCEEFRPAYNGYIHVMSVNDSVFKEIEKKIKGLLVEGIHRMESSSSFQDNGVLPQASNQKIGGRGYTMQNHHDIIRPDAAMLGFNLPWDFLTIASPVSNSDIIVNLPKKDFELFLKFHTATVNGVFADHAPGQNPNFHPNNPFMYSNHRTVNAAVTAMRYLTLYNQLSKVVASAVS